METKVGNEGKSVMEGLLRSVGNVAEREEALKAACVCVCVCVLSVP